MREGVDIENPPGPLAGKCFAEDAHKAGQHQQLCAVISQSLGDGGLKGGLAAQLLPVAHHPGNPRLGGPGEGVCLGVAGDHQNDLSIPLAPRCWASSRA